jgi:hypothetical protein
MAKYKDLLVSTKIVEAGRKRKCYHSRKHEIQKGELCFEVKEGIGWKGYCADCAEAMTAQADRNLQSLRQAMTATLAKS